MTAAEQRAGQVDVLLRDGRIAQLRRAFPDDDGLLRELNARLSPRTRLLRYFGAQEASGDWYVDRVVRSAPDRGTLLAEVDGTVVAVGSFFRTQSDPTVAEVAFLIDDEHHAIGLGTLLLEHLAQEAREQGITTFLADVMTDNAGMLDVFIHSGLLVRRTSSRGLTRAEIDLAPPRDFQGVVEAREGEAEHASLLPALAPRSIAVVGSSRADSIARTVLRAVVDGGFHGQVHAVGRQSEPIAACPGHGRVGEVGEAVDLVVIAVPAQQVLAVARDCAAAGARALLVLSAGFAETGPEGRALQEELLRLCREHSMRLLGPNCLGVVNTDPLVSLNATFCDAEPQPGSIALVSQSGAVGVAALRRAESSGVGLSLFVSTGNKADVSGNDLLAYLERDDRTSVVALYLESFGNARRFARVAARVGRSKPIVVVKSGRSAAGSRAGTSHTAAAATPDVAVDALFEQAGVLRADDLPEMFDIALVLATAPRPRGSRVVVIGNSGGPGVLAADACEQAGLSVLPLAAPTRAALRALLPPAAAVDNPVDLLATATPQDYERAVALVLADPDVDAVVAIYTPLTRGSEGVYAAALRSCAGAASGTPLLACFPGVPQPPAELRDETGRLISPCFEFPERAARALGKVVAHARWHARPFEGQPVPAGTDRTRARSVVEAALEQTGGGGWLDPEVAADVLRAYGIDCLASRLVTGADEAADAALELGLPVALKASGPGLVHKSDVGGVRLDLATADAVRGAFEQMQDRLGPVMTAALVQPMAHRTDRVELAAGVVVDDTVGPLVLVGAGGIYTDVLADRALRLLPLTVERAREQVLSLRCAPMLTGARGRPAADLAAVADTLVRLAVLAADLPEIVELDVNPLLAGPTGVVAVDVKMRVTKAAPQQAPSLRSLRATAPAAPLRNASADSRADNAPDDVRDAGGSEADRELP